MYVHRNEAGEIDQVYRWPNDNAPESTSQADLDAEVAAGNVVPALLEE